MYRNQEMNGTWVEQAYLNGNKSLELLEIWNSVNSKGLNSGENADEQRIIKMETRTDVLIQNVSQKYKEMKKKKD